MKRILSLILSTVMIFSIVLPAFATDPIQASAISVRYDSENVTVNPMDSAVLTLVVEGLGTDPDNNQADSIAFSSSDDSVATVGSYSVIPYTPSGESEPTGLAYEVTVDAGTTGIARITANIVDTNGNAYTDSCFVTVSGIIVRQKNITLEVGEACIVFAERYGFTNAQATRSLSWTRNGDDTGWISLGAHESGRQNEAYYIKGNYEGTGTVTVSLSGSGFSDTITVTVVSEKSVTVEQGGVEVDSLIDLSTASSVTLDATCVGFSTPTVIWESCNPELVSVSASGNSAVISRIAYSDAVAAVKVTATENDITRTKTVYFNVADQNDSISITSLPLEDGSITIEQGDTVTLSAQTVGLDSTATVWSATTQGGEVPVKLNSSVGKNITITGRMATTSPIIITAANGGAYDSVHVTVTPSEAKSVKITGENLGADGVVALATGDVAELTAEFTGFSDVPTVTWDVAIAKNSENSTGTGTCPVSLSNVDGISTFITAETASLDFARVRVSVTDGNTTYTDEILVKSTGCDIINSRYVSVFNKDVVTLSTTNGDSADWASNSQKTYFGSTSTRPTNSSGESASVSTNGTTLNPSRLTAEQNGYKDSVYVKVNSGSWKTVSYNLNGGYGKIPGTVVMSTNDTYFTFVLPTPEAVYPSDSNEYVFYGWSEKANAGQTDSNGVIYFAGEEYSVPSDKNNITLYAIWAKKTENALFSLRLTGDIPAEPSGQSISDYGKSCIYVENAINPGGFYFDVNGVESHLEKVPSDEDIFRALSINYINGEPVSFDPDTDRIIWYVIKKKADNAAGIANWHVDGVLVKGNRFSVTYNKNITVANVSGFPNPSRIFDYENTNVPIIDNVPTCNSDNFIGWNTRSDGRGQWYTSTGTLYNGHTTAGTVETSILLTEDVALYAIWDGRLPYDINEDGLEDFNDIALVISASAGEAELTAKQAGKADLNKDGIVDEFDAAELDRILLSNDNAKGDIDQDGDLDFDDYAMAKAHLSEVAIDENHPANLLDKSYLTSEYDSIKDNYPNYAIITQPFYCADYNSDKAVDAFDLFYLDMRLNNLI